jgi:hypothetical protein
MARSAVWIDNGAWDWLFDNNVDLGAELPIDNFELLITRQVELEMRMIRRIDVREFAHEMILRCQIGVRRVLGYDNPNVTEKMHRYGGFDQGHWASPAEAAFIRQQNAQREQTNLKGSGLFQHEGDIALAAKSFDGIVITAERKGGPLRDAEAAGGRVVRLGLLAERRLSLREACTSAAVRV